MSKNGKQLRYWIFTLNNPKCLPRELYLRFRKSRQFRFIIFQKEMAPETKTPHYQGYVGFKRGVRFSHVKSLLPNAHIEPRKGTHQQAYTYNTSKIYKGKPKGQIAGPWTYGDIPKLSQKPGIRTDLENVYADMQEGYTWESLVQKYPLQVTRYSKGLREVYKYKRKRVLRAPKNYPAINCMLFYGPSGTGKTRYAMQRYDVFKKTGTCTWFDGYEGESTIILDEFSGGRNKIPLSQLLGYLDRYPVKLPVKGDFEDRKCSTIIVTTNIHPRYWYNYADREEHYNALARRFTKVLGFFKDGSAYYLSHSEFFTNQNLVKGEKVELPWN